MNPDNQHQEKQTCQVCGKQYEHSFLYPAELVRPHLVQFIKKRIPDWDNRLAGRCRTVYYQFSE
jgi:hypothetical protein